MLELVGEHMDPAAAFLLLWAISAIPCGLAAWHHWYPGPLRLVAFIDRKNVIIWRRFFPRLTRRKYNRTIAITLWAAALVVVCCALFRLLGAR